MLKVNNLRKFYQNSDGGRDSVIDIEELSIESGEHFFLEGGSGTGKTTFLNLCSGILKPDQGSIKILDTDITTLNESNRDVFRGKHIGLLFQRFHLLPSLSILENVALSSGLIGKTLNWDYAKDLLDSLELSNKLELLPGQLSVGQQQRVALARALINNPSLVLADEPTSSLDPRLARKTMQLIRSSCKEKKAALVVVSHDPSLNEGFTRTLRLEDLNQCKHTSGVES